MKLKPISAWGLALGLLLAVAGTATPLATPWPWLALVAVSGMTLLRRKAGG